MDPLFDRIETLLKSFISGDSDRRDSTSSARGGIPPSGDPDLDDAMAELEADLAGDRDAREKLERGREARRKAEEAARNGANRRRNGPSGPPARILEDYKILGLRYGVPFAEVKAAYKRLLKEHHPDRHGDSPERQKRATETAARINDAYQRIETWVTDGKLLGGA